MTHDGPSLLLEVFLVRLVSQLELFMSFLFPRLHPFCWVHKPGVPRGPASTPRLGPSRQHITRGPAQGSRTTGRKGGPVTDRKVWPKRNSARSSTTSAHVPDQSARFGLQPPPDGLSDRKVWPKVLLSTPTPRLRPGFTETLLTALLRLVRPEPTGAIRPGTPTRKGPWDKRRKQAKTHKSNHGTRDHTLYACRNSTLQPP